MDAKIGQIIGVLLACTGKTIGIGDHKILRIKARWPFFQNPAQKRQVGSTFAMQNSSFGPPEDVLRMQERITMTHIATADCSHPEAVQHLLARDAAPGMSNIALI